MEFTQVLRREQNISNVECEFVIVALPFWASWLIPAPDYSCAYVWPCHLLSYYHFGMEICSTTTLSFRTQNLFQVLNLLSSTLVLIVFCAVTAGKC